MAGIDERLTRLERLAPRKTKRRAFVLVGDETAPDAGPGDLVVHVVSEVAREMTLRIIAGERTEAPSANGGPA